MFKKTSDVVLPVAFFMLISVIWQYLPAYLAVPEYILPTPSSIVTSFKGHMAEASYNYYITFVESFLGLMLGTVVGFIIGICMAQSSHFKKISLPFLIGLNAVPVVALAPIILIWFGSTLVAKVVVSAFISFFPIALNTFRGLTEYNNNYKHLFAVYGATEFEFLLLFKLRNARPYIITGLKLNATLSVIGSIIGEFVSPDKGLGYGILQASYSFNSPRMWGYIFMACSIGVFYYTIIHLFEHKITKNYT